MAKELLRKRNVEIPEDASFVPDQTMNYENRLAEANEYLLTLKMQLDRLRPVPAKAPRNRSS
jgi:hypothetical protein